MLVASGELPARLLQIRPPKFVSADKPPITEIDPGGRDFPIVKQNVWGVNESKTAYSTDRIIVQSLGIIGDHPALKNAIEKTCNLAKSNEPVLILGESGTGKELFAKLVHKCSERRDKPFVSLNCSAIPSDLAESTLFGHKKGGFTGAAGDRAGKFREADGGTIFLDELGELPLTLQAKLLRTIEQGEIEPVGGTTESVNVRVVAATNRKLSVEYQENDFRQDLYFRLCVGEVTLPALRDRRTDINKLALSFLDNFCETLRKRKTLSPEAMIKIESYSWPGNVRELSNVIKRAVLMSRETEISEEQIEVNLQSAHASLKFLPTPEPGFDLNKYIDLVRAELYSKAMTLGTDQKGAAALLGLSPPAVSQYLSKQKRTD
jgi:transcriptional regulator with GAF, ATPase, and Fis domain